MRKPRLFLKVLGLFVFLFLSYFFSFEWFMLINLWILRFESHNHIAAAWRSSRWSIAIFRRKRISSSFTWCGSCKRKSSPFKINISCKIKKSCFCKEKLFAVNVHILGSILFKTRNLCFSKSYECIPTAGWLSIWKIHWSTIVINDTKQHG